MNGNLKRIKITFILAILISSVFFAIIPTSTAQIGFAVDSQIVLDVESEDLEPDFDPLSGSYTVEVKMKFQLYGTAFGWSGRNVREQKVSINVNVETEVDWCTATLITSSPILLNHNEDRNITIQITVDEDAPTFDSKAVVKVSADCKNTNVPLSLFYIKGAAADVDIKFDVGYLSSINPIFDEYFKQISPEETADFKLTIENLGNAKTRVTFSVESIPAGWSVSIPAIKTVDSKFIGDGNSKITVPITVQPPKNFGYHDERVTIKIKMTPSYFALPDDPGYTGRTIEELITIESRGFAFGTGFELIGIISVIILIIVVIIFYRKYRSTKKGK